VEKPENIELPGRFLLCLADGTGAAAEKVGKGANDTAGDRKRMKRYAGTKRQMKRGKIK
jgi:hypothetical protein